MLITAVTIGWSGTVAIWRTIGNKTSEVQTLGTAAQSQLTSVTTAQQSESGVNSDQELANMIRYQTAYQAGAKVIQAASDMFTTLFALS